MDTQARREAALACILDLGELLLTSGAEVMRVEDTVARLCAAYGFETTDVFTITSSIVVTARAPDGRVLTQTRRIRERSTDLGCVERVNALSRRLCAPPLPAVTSTMPAPFRLCRARRMTTGLTCTLAAINSEVTFSEDSNA